jgi:hypothetical protein
MFDERFDVVAGGGCCRRGSRLPPGPLQNAPDQEITYGGGEDPGVRRGVSWSRDAMRFDKGKRNRSAAGGDQKVGGAAAAMVPGKSQGRLASR